MSVRATREEPTLGASTTTVLDGQLQEFNDTNVRDLDVYDKFFFRFSYIILKMDRVLSTSFMLIQPHTRE